MGNHIRLEFYGIKPQLTKCVFTRECGQIFTTVRGRSAGAIHAAGSFQWTSAVIATCSLLLRTALVQLMGGDPQLAIISGYAGSPAATLDYALSKQPMWTIEMFGLDGSSQSYLRRMLLRTNSERKMPGPVLVSVNSRALRGANIEIWWKDRKISSVDELKELTAHIEECAKSSDKRRESSQVDLCAA